MGTPNEIDDDKVKKSAWYSLGIMTGSFAMGELCHFLIGITSKAISQDLQYGDQSCLSEANILSPDNATSCEKFPDESQCTNATYGNQVYCEWNYNGLGIEYQILAGPCFIAAYTIGCVIMGILAGTFSRKNILAVCTLLFSVCTIVTGFAQAFWQLVLLRIGLALGESACQPLSASMISDTFPQSKRGAAMGIVNLGIYVGYGLSFAVGNYVTAANILGEGWRWSYYLSGIPGVIMAGLLFLTKEPAPAQSAQLDGKESAVEKISDNEKINTRDVLAFFCKPITILLCVASCIRQTSGFTWGYNSALYYQNYYPEAEIGTWLTVIPIVGGSFGIVTGGWLSDKVVSRLGLQARAWVLAGSQLLAAPCALGVLYLPPPYTFISQLVAYLFSETWIGILFAIIAELSPANGITTILAVFLFVMNNIGGNLPLIVDPLTKAMGFRGALVLMYPGMMAFSATAFGVIGFVLRNQAVSSEEKTDGEKS